MIAFRGPRVEEYTATPSRPKEEVIAVNRPPNFLVQCAVLSQRMMRDTLRRPVLLACHFVANVYFGSEWGSHSGAMPSRWGDIACLASLSICGDQKKGVLRSSPSDMVPLL